MFLPPPHPLPLALNFVPCKYEESNRPTAFSLIQTKEKQTTGKDRKRVKTTSVLNKIKCFKKTLSFETKLVTRSDFCSTIFVKPCLTFPYRTSAAPLTAHFVALICLFGTTQNSLGLFQMGMREKARTRWWDCCAFQSGGQQHQPRPTSLRLKRRKKTKARGGGGK